MVQEQVSETKKCKMCWISFDITSQDLEFYDKASPVIDWVKFSIPAPTLCPDCRRQRRMACRNERNLYKRNCDATGKSMISIYSPETKWIVYHQDEWWSDRWNALDYWKTMDFKRSFFAQFWELLEAVPKLSVVVMNAENSEYTNWWAWNKDSYMIFLSSNNEKCLYSRWIFDSKSLIDCSNVNKSENCYELIKSAKCYNCQYSKYLEDCNDCYFSFNLKWCRYCINCENMENQSYCVNNIQVTKDEFENALKNLDFKAEAKKFKDKYLLQSTPNLNCDNCTWHDLKNSKNIIAWEDWSDAQDCKYVGYFMDMKDSYDINFQAYETSLVYESIWFEKVNSSMWVFLSLWLSNVYYSQYCFNCSNLFWCVGLSNKEYCILNKQYSKEEYLELLPKIIEHMMMQKEWWEFFPASISPFGYNETVAMEYYPIERADAMNRIADGKTVFNWLDYESARPEVSKIIPSSKLPQNIWDVPDDILNWAIECENTKKPFRIIKQELEFYREHNLPIPTLHPDERHLWRMQKFPKI
ncbi:MAG: hypothetical protein ACD_2C00089G0002 [uncultured bacterium (gcode 4)]|uniref:Uncharacterized protein n=1 Tax=uncultured bacterium (gcode 4) TaxID=1234023 RepID=K2H1W1_9BACT|nr:MAG: hypothetical protein ACD_2C00089G0002 [uncultured bacterium (gcode 4)]